MDIQELNNRISQIDTELVRLYCARMDTACMIGAYKREYGLPTENSEQDRTLMNKAAEQAGSEKEHGVRALFQLLLEHSRLYQELETCPQGVIGRIVREAIESTPSLFPEKTSTACQGVEGAYSQQACEKMIRYPSITYCPSFEDVFSAIENGQCRYGVLPIENSLAGSVSSVYDLMIRHNCYIVRSARIRIDHTLLALPGTRMDQIREIFSHEQAIHQCSAFLAGHPEWHVNVSSNTAAAARMLRESGRPDAAAISSVRCAPLYGLVTLASDIQNSSNNHTRFICVSGKPEVFPGADHTSLMLALPNKPGALYRLLSRFNALGINLTKLESRPIPGRDFEFMFCFDLDVSVYSPSFSRLIDELDVILDRFVWLGSYSEVT